MTILRRLAYVGLAGLWFVVVFSVSWWLTFPSQAVAEFVRYQVQKGSNDTRILMLDGVSPSGFGVRADGLELYRRDKGANAGTSLLFTADQVRLHAWPWSLLRLGLLGGTGNVSGSVSREGGDVDFAIALDRSDGKVAVRGAQVYASELPISALPDIAGGRVVGTGGLGLDVSLDAPTGLSKSEGHITLSSQDLVIEKIEAPGTALETLDLGAITISNVDVSFDVEGGKARVSRGEIVSDLVKADISGDVVLKDDVAQSQLRLKVVLTLGDSLQMFKSFLADALWDEDGAYHYGLSGTLQRPRFRAEHERKAAPTSTRIPARPGEATLTQDTPPRDVPEASDDRAIRRQQALEDRRRQMEERRQALGADNPQRPPAIEDDQGSMPPPYEEPNDVGPPPDDELPQVDENGQPIEEPFPEEQ
jgi:type II secretion system protein N